MRDPRTVETIESVLALWFVHPTESGDMAASILDALDAEGYALYRPEDCELGQIDGVTFNDNPEGMVRLVPEAPDAR